MSAGKTVIASFLVDYYLKKGKRIAFVVDSEELIKQTVATFGQDCSVLKAGYEKDFDSNKPLQIIMIQTFYARKNRLPDMDLDMLIIDEVHIGWQKGRMIELCETYDNAKIIGLSATPINERGYLLDGFDDYINEVQVKDLIEQGYLVKPICYTPQNCVLDLSKVRMSGYDYNSQDVDEIVLDTEKVAKIVDAWEDLARDRKTLVFASSIKHAEKIYQEYVKRGYTSVALLHSQLEDLTERRKDFKDKQIVVNCGILTKGYDDKRIDCVVMARPTKVLSLYIQCVGRGLRCLTSKKDCIIIDVANCIALHGLPDDLRFYTKEPVKKHAKATDMICPECGAVVSIDTKICPYCGYEFTAEQIASATKQSKKEIDRMVKALDLQKELKEKIKAEVIHRGYKRGFAWYLFVDCLKTKKPTESSIMFFKKRITKLNKIIKKKWKLQALRYE